MRLYLELKKCIVRAEMKKIANLWSKQSVNNAYQKVCDEDWARKNLRFQVFEGC